MNIMRIRIMLLTALFFSLMMQRCYPVDLTQEQEPVAMIVCLAGDGVLVHHADAMAEASPARMGMKLYTSDIIWTSAGSTCSLLLIDGQLVKVPSQSSVTMGTELNRRESVAQISPGMSSFLLKEEPRKGDSASSDVPLRTRGPGDGPIPLSPKDYAVMTDKPLFEWSEVPGALQYVLMLINKEGDTWTKEVQGTRTEYPSDFPKLKLGESWFWQVDALSKKFRKSSESSTFVVVSEEVKKALEDLRTELSSGSGMDRERGFLLAMAYQKHDLLEEAAAEYKNMIEVEPGFAFAHEQLGLVYSKMGRIDQAIELLNKAAELDPSSSRAHEELARLYQAKGDPDMAKREQEIVGKMALAARGLKK